MDYESMEYEIYSLDTATLMMTEELGIDHHGNPGKAPGGERTRSV
jgi:hypothetical protein